MENCILNYEEIVSKTAQLMKELNITDTIELCNIFSYMLYSGMFSKDHKYSYKPVLMKSAKSQYDFGMTIMAKKGACLNNVFLLDAVLKKSEIYGEKMSVKTMGGTINYKMPVHRVTSENIFDKLGEIIQDEAAKDSKTASDHLCEIIKYEGKLFIYDPTCMCIYQLGDNLEAQALNGTKKVAIRPYQALVMDDNSNISETLRYYTDIIREKISEEEKIKMEKLTLQLFKQSLEKFHQKKDYLRISMII